MIQAVPSETLLQLLRQFEGCCRIKRDGLVHPYLCPAGLPTQGYGHLVRDLQAPPITREQAEAWLLEDAARHLSLALALSPSLAAESDARRSAIGSFVFNLGPGKYRASTLRKRVNEGEWEEAAEQLRKWVFGGGKKLPGLLLRREAEAALLLQEMTSEE
jgi:lysozyme